MHLSNVMSIKNFMNVSYYNSFLSRRFLNNKSDRTTLAAEGKKYELNKTSCDQSFEDDETYEEILVSKIELLPMNTTNTEN